MDVLNFDNKIEYGLCNVHYAIRDRNGIYTRPRFLDGSIILSLEPMYTDYTDQGEDGGVYPLRLFHGYTGTLTIYTLDDIFREQVWGETFDINGVQIEHSVINSNQIALLFERQGDATSKRYLLPLVTVTKSSLETETIKAQPGVGALALQTMVARDPKTGIVSCRVSKEKGPIYDSWFEEVYTPRLKHNQGVNGGPRW